VQLTAAGRRLIERAFAQHRAEMEEALEGFPIDERRELLPMLRRLGRTAEASAEMVKGAQSDSKPGARRSSK
jgi:MarR family 2-MHQ and catechol resistance regulon transcriptional repressor